MERSSEEGEVGGESCGSSKNTREGMQGSERAGEEGEAGAPGTIGTMVPRRWQRGAVPDMSLL